MSANMPSIADLEMSLHRYDASAYTVELRFSQPDSDTDVRSSGGDAQIDVKALQKLLPDANLVQLDAGWWRERGDYGGVREDLGAGGLKQFAAEFRARGLTAGVHLDGMRFSPDSVVAREHPEYFLHDEHGRPLREQRSVNGQVRHYFVDYSHPGACAYMRDSLRRLRREWGFDYFKIDFLRAGIAEDVRRAAFDDVQHVRQATAVRLH